MLLLALVACSVYADRIARQVWKQALREPERGGGAASWHSLLLAERQEQQQQQQQELKEKLAGEDLEVEIPLGDLVVEQLTSDQLVDMCAEQLGDAANDVCMQITYYNGSCLYDMPVDCVAEQACRAVVDLLKDKCITSVVFDAATGSCVVQKDLQCADDQFDARKTLKQLKNWWFAQVRQWTE